MGSLGGKSVPSLLSVTLPDPIPTQDCCCAWASLHLKCCHHPCPRDCTASASPRLSLPSTAVLMPWIMPRPGTAPPPKPWLQRSLAGLTSFPSPAARSPQHVPALYPLETSVHRLPSLPSLAFSLTLKSSILPTPQLPCPLPVPCPCPACLEL